MMAVGKDVYGLSTNKRRRYAMAALIVPHICLGRDLCSVLLSKSGIASISASPDRAGTNFNYLLKRSATMADVQDRTDTPNNVKPTTHLIMTRPYKDCLSCRIIGTGTLIGIGSYSLWQSRATAPGSWGQKKIVAGLGVGAYTSITYCRVF